MTQQFSVLIDTVSYTDKTVTCSVTSSVGRGFNTASLTMTGIEPTLLLHKDVTIIHGDNVFNGFVFSHSKSSNNSFELTLRSNGAKLGEPFFLNKDGIANATTALDLCTEYSLKSGVSITYNTEDIDFGGSWVETGTPLLELIKLANITGADIYDDGTGIVIEPAKYVNGIPINIEPDEVLDFVNISEDISNNGVGFVITKTYESTGSNSINNDTNIDIISKDQVYGDVNEHTGQIKLYSTPYDSSNSVTGATVLRDNQYDVLTEKKMFTDEVSMTTKGQIVDVKKVLLNGLPISNYHTDGNVLFFDTPQTGEVSLEYGTKYSLLQAKVEPTPSGNFANVEVVKGSQIFRWAGFVSDKADDYKSQFSSSSLGYVIPDGTAYSTGFDLYTFGDPAKFKLYSGANVLDTSSKITSSTGTFPQFESVSLNPKDDGSYSAYTKLPINSVTDVTSAGSSIPYTVLTDANGKNYVHVDQYYPNVEVSYNSTGEKHHIQYPLNTDNEEQTLLLYTDNEENGFEIPLVDPLNDDEEYDWYDPSNFPCGYPANFPLNVAQLLSLQIVDIQGIDVPNLGTVDDKGFLYANITQDGIYEYDTSVLKDRTSITVRANSNGSL